MANDILRSIPKTNIRRWTTLAKECYERGCSCQGCVYNKLFQTVPQCMMKATVLELVRVLGMPDGVEREDIV